jgi:hypothetical protein
VGADTNSAYDLYDARLGGGFPEQATAQPCGVDLACRGTLPPPPPPAVALSQTLRGSGNKKVCGKGRIRRGGKCIKPKKPKSGHHKQKKHKKRSSHKRGGNR